MLLSKSTNFMFCMCYICRIASKYSFHQKHPYKCNQTKSTTPSFYSYPQYTHYFITIHNAFGHRHKSHFGYTTGTQKSWCSQIVMLMLIYMYIWRKWTSIMNKVNYPVLVRLAWEWIPKYEHLLLMRFTFGPIC